MALLGVAVAMVAVGIVVGATSIAGSAPSAIDEAASASGPTGNATGATATQDLDRHPSVMDSRRLALRPRSRRLSGRVVARESRRPLACTITGSRAGTRWFTEPRTGRFELEATAGETIHVVAIGYEEAAVTVRDDMGSAHLEIALRALPVTVRIKSRAGLPVASAGVYAAPARGYADPGAPPRLLGLTDHDGRLEARIERPAVIFAIADGAASSFARVDGVRKDIEMSLRFHACHVGLRRAKGEPIAGLALRLATANADCHATLRLETDAAGITTVALPSGAYQVSDTVGRLRFRASRALDGVDTGRNRANVRLAGGITWLTADLLEGWALVLRDAESRTLLSSVEYWLELRETAGPFKGEWVATAPPTHVELDHGRLELARFTDPRPAGRRLCLAPLGYESRIIDRPEALMAAQTDVEVLFHRRSPKYLRLNPATYSTELTVAEIQSGIMPFRLVLFRGRPTKEGLIGPFPWRRGDVELSLAGRGNVALAKVASSEFTGKDVVPVEVARPGAIVVRGVVPDAPPIYCFSEAGQAMVGRARDGRLVFSGLPGGQRYRVGPAEYSRSTALAAARDLDADWIRLAPGQTYVTSWRKDWIRTRVSGRVRVTGGTPPRLFVAPSYGIGDDLVTMAADEARVPVGPDGRFELRSGCRPSFLRLGMWNRNQPVPIAVFRPGNDVSVGFARVRLGLPAEVRGPARVVVLWRPFLGKGRKNIVVGTTVLDHVTARVLDLGWLPTNVSYLDVRVGGRRRVIRVSLEPGEDTRVDA